MHGYFSTCCRQTASICAILSLEIRSGEYQVLVRRGCWKGSIHSPKLRPQTTSTCRLWNGQSHQKRRTDAREDARLIRLWWGVFATPNLQSPKGFFFKLRISNLQLSATINKHQKPKPNTDQTLLISVHHLDPFINCAKYTKCEAFGDHISWRCYLWWVLALCQTWRQKIGRQQESWRAITKSTHQRFHQSTMYWTRP